MEYTLCLESRYIGKTMYLERSKRPIIWNGGEYMLVCSCHIGSRIQIPEHILVHDIAEK